QGVLQIQLRRLGAAVLGIVSPSVCGEWRRCSATEGPNLRVRFSSQSRWSCQSCPDGQCSVFSLWISSRVSGWGVCSARLAMRQWWSASTLTCMLLAPTQMVVLVSET
ncbi:hypothetical protein GBAR_LOCUS1439, partial [Geodia barretti]